MTQAIILRGLSNETIDKLVEYYQWFPQLTMIENSNKLIAILESNGIKKIGAFYDLMGDIIKISERYNTKTKHSVAKLYKVFVWYLYHRFVEKYNYLEDIRFRSRYD